MSRLTLQEEGRYRVLAVGCLELGASDSLSRRIRLKGEFLLDVFSVVGDVFGVFGSVGQLVHVITPPHTKAGSTSMECKHQVPYSKTFCCQQRGEFVICTDRVN
jgi:hypothetical protein